MDTWKIRPNLTFDLGVRYEVPINWHYVNGTYSAFSPRRSIRRPVISRAA